MGLQGGARTFGKGIDMYKGVVDRFGDFALR